MRRVHVRRAAAPRRLERGHTLVEYLVALALIAIGALGTLRAFGDLLSEKTGEFALRIRTMDATSAT